MFRDGMMGLYIFWKAREYTYSVVWMAACIPKVYYSYTKDHLEDQGVGGKMGSEWILGRLAWGVWIVFDWLRTGTGGGLV
jgi:hypothetical protein